MLEIIYLFSRQLNRHHRRYVFSHKSTRHLRDNYRFQRGVDLVYILRPADEPND